MLQIQVDASQPCCQSACEGDGTGLPKSLKEYLIEPPIFPARNQRSEGSRLSADPGNGDGLNRICQTERHSHLARLHGTAKCKEDGIENPKQEVPGEPAYSNSPLEWPDFLIPSDAMRSDLMPQ